MEYVIDKEILDAIQLTIENYTMFTRTEKSILALSGGKDSLFTMLCLKELGYTILPVIVDMGYEEDWHTKIQKISKRYGLEAKTINIRGQDFQNLLDNNTLINIKESLNFLDNLEINNEKDVTPCTQCYNAKITALTAFSSKNGTSNIIFGHHGTDAIVSFLKSALMYIDRWDNNHEVFTKSNFKILLENIKFHFFEPFDIFLKTEFAQRLLNLVDLGVVSTDEPPVQFLDTSTQSIKIFRPLFNIFENTIVDFQNKFKLTTEGSGCGHSLTKETQTPRELIHYEVINKVHSQSFFEIKVWLLHLIKMGLFKDGTLKVNARKNREKLLGSQYKINLGCSSKLY